MAAMMYRFPRGLVRNGPHHVDADELERALDIEHVYLLVFWLFDTLASVTRRAPGVDVVVHAGPVGASLQSVERLLWTLVSHVVVVEFELIETLLSMMTLLATYKLPFSRRS